MNYRNVFTRTELHRVLPVALLLAIVVTGCGPYYPQLRREGQRAMIKGDFAQAKFFFKKAEEKAPRRVQNLHDLGACGVALARVRFEELNRAAAMRELDSAVAYYGQAIEVYPGHQASLEGMNVALELQGQFDKALAHAEWAAKFVGPSAKQYLFLASELEERGDLDGALLRHRQAVAMEPQNASAHVAIAKFLFRRNNDQAAIHYLQNAYRLDPTDDWVVDQLAARSAIPPLAREAVPNP